MSKWLSLGLFVALIGSSVALALADSGARYGFGRSPSPAEIASWNIDVRGGDGRGLPPGHGSVSQGEQIYENKCASCHGDFGEGTGRMPVLAGGQGTLTAERPLPTVGSYWPYAPTLFDYIHRAMPFTAPQSLTNDQVYALTAYVLYLNNIVPKGAVLDAKSLAAVKMPNRNGFVRDPRPDVHNVACMRNCKPLPVRITSDLARELQVTPTSAPSPSQAPAPAPVEHASFADVRPIVAMRCAVCHSAHPSEAGYTSAPMGIMFDTPAEIKAATQMIRSQAVVSHAMPLGNVTKMTDQERALLGRWIAAGAPIP